jgi:MFS family permease
MRDLGFAARPLTLETLRTELATVAKTSIRHGWSQRSLRLLMLASAVQTSFLVWGFYAWQPYFQQLLETDAVWFAGVVASGVALSGMLGNAVVDYFARLCGRRTTLLVWAASIQTLAAIAVGLSPSFPLALLCLLVATSTMGVVGPVRQAYLHGMVPAEKRATVVSFDSMVANLGGVGGQAGLGYLAKVRDYAAGYVVGGAVTVLAIPLFLAIRSSKEAADRIIGRAGKSAPCAARGLAFVGAVDDKAHTAEAGA